MLKIKFFLFLFYSFSNFLCQFSNFNSFPRASKQPLRSASSSPEKENGKTSMSTSKKECSSTLCPPASTLGFSDRGGSIQQLLVGVQG